MVLVKEIWLRLLQSLHILCDCFDPVVDWQGDIGNATALLQPSPALPDAYQYDGRRAYGRRRYDLRISFGD